MARHSGSGADDGIALRFWGVRGSLPTPGPSTVRYGGNTACVELRCGPHLLILDAGSGMRELGAELAGSGTPTDADILLTHAHLDHICGVPFFAPVYAPGAALRFWGAMGAGPGGTRDALARSLTAPLMPDLDRAFRADVSYRDFAVGARLAIKPGLTADTAPLSHPGGCVGYRIAWSGASLCYIVDVEHAAGGPDAELARFVAGADVMIYDASYTDEEYATRIGWGHSTWRAAADLADAGGVGRLVLFHHDPMHGDDAMDAIADAIEARRPGSLVAQEGVAMTVRAVDKTALAKGCAPR